MFIIGMIYFALPMASIMCFDAPKPLWYMKVLGVGGIILSIAIWLGTIVGVVTLLWKLLTLIF